MESFYSLIYYKTNTLTDELVCIGMIGGGGEGPYMFISDERMKFLKKVIHPNTFLSINRRLKGLKYKVDSYREENPGTMLFDTVFSKERLNELSEQTKNAIVYSQPTVVNEWMNEEFFNRIVESFFGQEKVKPKRKRPVYHLVWRAYYQSNKFETWERDLVVNELVDNVPLALTLDLVNKESKEVYIGFNFDLSRARLRQKTYEVELLRSSLPDYTFYLIHPIPKTDLGKEWMKAFKKKNLEIELVRFSTFKKQH